jgi:hypothetical protein
MNDTVKRALIIRSASFQQLDKNLPDIVSQLPAYTFDMLTHEHGIKLAQKYEMIDKVISYPYKDSFHYKNKVKELNDISYDVVIILVTNITGVGFWNVIRFAFTVSGKQYLQCNMQSELMSFSKKRILWRSIQLKSIKLVSILIAALLSPLTILILCWKLVVLRDKTGGIS